MTEINNNYYNQLSKGAIGHILDRKQLSDPVFQLIAYKQNSTDNSRRYRLSLSDGIYSFQCFIIAGDLVDKIENNEYDRFCLLKAKRYLLNELNQGNDNRRAFIVLSEIEMLAKGSEVKCKLGNPILWGSPNAPPLSNYPLNSNRNQEEDMDFDDDLILDAEPSTSHQSTSTLNPALALPISSLTPYSNKWLVKGRILSKTGLRSYSNAKGSGNIFSFNIKDSSSDIKLTAFKAECNKYFDFIKVGDVYLISKGIVKTANKRYSTTTSDYEITITKDTVIERCSDDSDCPKITYKFEEFDKFKELNGSYVDLIGVLKQINETFKINSKKNNKELNKREICLIDVNKKEIDLTIWNEMALGFSAELGDVIVVRGARIGEYNGGLNVSTTMNSTLEINPDIEQVLELKDWYSRNKDNLNDTTKITKNNAAVYQWGNLDDINFEKLSKEDDQTISLQTKAVINRVGKANMYKSCLKCKKKLSDMNNGTYRCETCNEDHDRFAWRIILSFSIADHSNNAWVQTFDEESRAILGDCVDVQKLGELFETDPAEFEDMIKNISFKSFIFKVRSKIEHFNEENKIKTSAKVSPIDYLEYGNYLIDQIKKN